MTFHPQYPHCNSEVLHAPGQCVYCDMYPERQQARVAGGTPFTSRESNGWHGNVAQTQEMVDEEAKFWNDLAKTMHRPLPLRKRIRKALKQVKSRQNTA